MCSLSCVHTLQQRQVAYSQSLLITARFLHWRLLKILLSSFILPFYILKILALKRMCSLFSCSLLSCSLLCQNRKRNWNKNYAKFASSSLAFSIFQAHHFYISIFFYFFLFNCSVGSSCKKTILQTHNIANTQLFHLHVVCKCTCKHCNMILWIVLFFWDICRCSIPWILYCICLFKLMSMNMNLVWCYKVEKNLHTKRVTKKFIKGTLVQIWKSPYIFLFI